MQHTTSIRSNNWSKGAPVAIYLLLQYMFPCEKLAYAQFLPSPRLYRSEFLTWEHVLKEDIGLKPFYGARQFVKLVVQIPCMCVTIFDRSVALLASRYPVQRNHNSEIGAPKQSCQKEVMCVIFLLVFLLGSRQCAHLSLARFLPDTEDK